VNFLAHCALGDGSDALLAGGFLGDFVKGAVPEDVPDDVQTGIRLHRRLDAFSATEPGMQASVSRLPRALRRFAPPFVDLLADHLLARDFEGIHGVPLAHFSTRVFDAIATHDDLLPPRARRFLAFMRSTNLFLRYREIDAVEDAFARVTIRLGHPEIAAPMLAAARAQIVPLTADFETYYPRLRAHAGEWLRARAGG
jgi:acyl carrier protein phosphodiesterase